jgi:hypothetical protein
MRHGIVIGHRQIDLLDHDRGFTAAAPATSTGGEQRTEHPDRDGSHPA